MARVAELLIRVLVFGQKRVLPVVQRTTQTGSTTTAATRGSASEGKQGQLGSFIHFAKRNYTDNCCGVKLTFGAWLMRGGRSLRREA
jgi:hypothetical protein